MSAEAIGVFLLVLVMILLFLAIIAYIRKEEKSDLRWYVWLCTSTASWAICSIFVYLLWDEKMAYFFQNIRLTFVCTTAVVIYIFAQQILDKKEPNWVVMICLWTYPVMTFFVASTNTYHGLLYKSISFTYEDGVRFVSATNGIWFWSMCIFGYILVMLSVIQIVRQLVRLQGRYRASALYLLFALLACAGASVAEVMRIFPYNFDLTPYVALCMNAITFFALNTPTSTEMILSSKKVIFEQSVNPMFIVNSNDEVIDLNVRAKEQVMELGIKTMRNLKYHEVKDLWMKKKDARVFPDNESIFTIVHNERDVHYQEVICEMYSKKGKIIGVYIEIKNITPIMSLVHKLQDAAYFDNLTGLRNRNYFIQIVNDWSTTGLLEREILPLGIVVGDVNGLKKVNDTFSHSKGDLLLQTVASDLFNHRPNGAIVFRMGGDEFTTLVPKAKREEMDAYISAIESKNYGQVDPNFVDASIAISYVIKTDSKKSIMESVHEADVLMYTKKNNRRRR